MKQAGKLNHFAGPVVRGTVLSAIALLLSTPKAEAAEVCLEAKFLGHQSCVECHEGPVEAWQRTGHAQRSLQMLEENLRVSRYAERLQLQRDGVLGSDSCLECHASQQRSDHGYTRVLGGVSCESCHGGAGPSNHSDGWYDIHSGEEDPPEGEELEDALDKAGMARTDNLYELAVRCYRCHSVSREEVVQAGHVTGTHEFEWTAWFAGEVRHNFAPYTIDADEDVNSSASSLWLDKHTEAQPRARQRLMFAVGQMADLEVNLRNRARASAAGTFATAAASRSIAALIRLRQIADLLEDRELANLVAEVEQIQALLFTPPHHHHTLDLLATADRVAQTAKQFLKTYDGEGLTAIEPLLALETKGTAYQPEVDPGHNVPPGS